jgi:hypothetical protein
VHCCVLVFVALCQDADLVHLVALWHERNASYTHSMATAPCDMGCPCAGSQREVDEIVTDYLGGGKQVGQTGTAVAST